APPAAPRGRATPGRSERSRRALAWPRRALVRQCTSPAAGARPPLGRRRTAAVSRRRAPAASASLAQPHLLGELRGLLGRHAFQLLEEAHVERYVTAVWHVVDEELVAVAGEHHDQFGAGSAAGCVHALDRLVG